MRGHVGSRIESAENEFSNLKTKAHVRLSWFTSRGVQKQVRRIQIAVSARAEAPQGARAVLCR